MVLSPTRDFDRRFGRLIPRGRRVRASVRCRTRRIPWNSGVQDSVNRFSIGYCLLQISIARLTSPLFGCLENLNPAMEKLSQTGTEDASPSSQDHKHWIEAQEVLKRRLIAEDDFPWKLPSTTEEGGEMLRYVGGVDVSFAKEDPSVACGTIVVLDIQNLQVVYQEYSLVTLDIPYVPGFLAFREAPILLELLQKMKKSDASVFYPQLLMVDGNGILHPRGFGLACHLGVLAELPTVGIGKNLHHVDGLTYSGVRKLLEAKENYSKDFITLTGCSGHVWGVAMRSTEGASKPIFVSVGHRLSLDTAIRIVKMTCKYRVPEPVRQADIRSREYLRKHQVGISE